MTNGRERMREIRRESLERAGFSIQFKGLDLALDEAMSTYAAEAVRAEREKWLKDEHALSDAYKDASTVEISPIVRGWLTPNRERKVQSFEYYAAHFIVGSGVISKDLDGLICAWAHELETQYKLGVEHGLRHPGDVSLKP